MLAILRFIEQASMSSQDDVSYCNLSNAKNSSSNLLIDIDLHFTLVYADNLFSAYWFSHTLFLTFASLGFNFWFIKTNVIPQGEIALVINTHV